MDVKFYTEGLSVQELLQDMTVPALLMTCLEVKRELQHHLDVLSMEHITGPLHTEMTRGKGRVRPWPW